VLARVRSPKIVTAAEVSVLQKALSEALERPVEMVVRTMVSRDVAAAGSIVQAARPDLDGLLVTPNLSANDRKERLAEQLIIEKLGDEPGFELGSVDYGETTNYSFVVVSLQMMAPIVHEQVRELRDTLRERFDNPTMELLVRHDRAFQITAHENFLMNWTGYYNFDEGDFEVFAELRNLVKEEVEKFPDVFCIGVHLNDEGGDWRVLAEVVGPHPPTPAQVEKVRKGVAERTPRPVELFLWFRSNTVVTNEGHLSYEEFTKETKEIRLKRLRTRTRKGLKPSSPTE
jgi:hypothetical protein